MTSLWQDFLDLGNFDAAWAKVRSNGGAAGGDGVSIAQFQPAAARRLTDLSRAVAAGKWEPLPCRTVEVPKRRGGTRRLTIPSVADRVVHTALAQVLSPVLDAQFEPSSYAYRPGRSVQQAVAEVIRLRDLGYWHVAEADIVGFFDNVLHDKVLGKLDAGLNGQEGAEEVVDLVGLILAHQGVESGVEGKGLAQGSPLSPLLANLALDAMDERLERRGVRLIRFADDFVMLAKKRDRAEDALEDARSALAEEGLELHAGKSAVRDFDRGFEFLGVEFIRSFALRPISDPEEDAVAFLREIAERDRAEVGKAELKAREAKGGYDRGARVLYVIEPGRRLGLRNLSFAVENAEGREMAAIAHGRVDRIEVGPGVTVDPQVIEHALSTETDFAFTTRQGELRGLLARPSVERADLHLAQAAVALDPARATIWARALVDARIRNQRTQLFRLNRRRELAEVTRALAAMGRFLRKLDGCDSVATLRGIEGAAAAEYWPALGLLTDGAPEPFRRDRPAEDMVNASINYVAAILLRDMRVAVLAAGLHPGFGTLHAVRDYAEAAVYDLMEPFRAPLGEGLVAYLFNARRLRPEMFSLCARDTVRIGGAARRALVAGYESALSRKVNVTGRSYKLAWRPLMRRQALDLAASLRSGDPKDFRPYLMEP